MDFAALARAIENSDRQPPAGVDHRRAAVFVLLSNADQPHLLLIQRADRGDPWSSHIAFPGGHIDAADADALAAAYRETKEEIGVGRKDIAYLADLGHFQTRGVAVDVQAFVGAWTKPKSLRINPAEVAEILEVSLASFLRQHRDCGFAAHHADRLGKALAYTWEGRRIWGVTARIIHRLMTVAAPLGPAVVDVRAG